MAFVDFTVFEELVIRGGALLVPLGRVNVNHDGPIRELVDRPLVSQLVIPTTLTEAGLGIHGRLRLGQQASLRYEVYVVNGFRLLSADGALASDINERETLLGEGKPSVGGDYGQHDYLDVNDGSLAENVATTGRLGLRIRNSLEVGGSFHAGTYDERADYRLSIVAADFSSAWGPLNLEGELAWAGFERDAFARTAGIPDTYWGSYVQVALGGVPSWVRAHVPYLFDADTSRLTLVVRYDYVNLDSDRGEAIEPGFVFRPVSDTAFKLSYRFGLRSVGTQVFPGGRRPSDDGIAFGITSYF